MTNSGSAAHLEGTASAQLAQSATSVFRHLGEVSQRLMQLQAQAAGIVLMDSAARYAEVMEGLRSFGVAPWMQVRRAQERGATGPLEAWIEATIGLQAVLAAAFLQGVALAVFPASAAVPSIGLSERRFNSVVIPFPDRRRNAAF